FIVFVLLEVKDGAARHGIGKEIKETLILVVCAAAFIFLLSIVLKTSSPVSAVVSCSMLPNLDRGEMIVLYGDPEPKGHEISMDASGLEGLKNAAATVRYDGKEKTVQGSMMSYCYAVLANAVPADSACTDFFTRPEAFSESRGPVTFNYGRCALRSGGKETDYPCVVSASFQGRTYRQDYANDVIDYKTVKGSPLYYSTGGGEIIHRLFFKISTDDGKAYYLTKGDNNPVFDLQFYDYGLKTGEAPVTQEQYNGKILARAPYIGYLKLFISGFWEEQAQCRQVLVY
ncbi:MAG: hypothetical protein ACP5NX_00025, partial [Candidatus Bilamarchaeaceae archaeon]